MNYGEILTGKETDLAMYGEYYVGSDKLSEIYEHPENCVVGRLTSYTDYLFLITVDGENCQGARAFQYVRRVINKPKRRPYINTAEMIDDFKKRFGAKKVPPYANPLIWICDSKRRDELLVLGFCEYGSMVRLSNKMVGVYELYENYTYLDGSPCCILEEE